MVSSRIHHLPMMALMDKASHARLAFWGMNMVVATGGKNN